MQKLSPELEPLFVPPTVLPDGSFAYACVDKNPPDSNCTEMATVDAYYQLPGGANSGLVVATACEYTSPGFAENQAKGMRGRPGIQILGKIFTASMATRDPDNLKGPRYTGLIHGQVCLATVSEQDIALGMALPSDVIKERAQAFDPTFTRRKQRKMAEAAERVIDAFRFLTPGGVDEFMQAEQHHEDGYLPPVPKAILEPISHAKRIIANYCLETVFSPREAARQGQQSYCVSMSLAEAAARKYPVNPNAFRHALALSMGVISTHPLIRDEHGQLLPIEVRGL